MVDEAAVDPLCVAGPVDVDAFLELQKKAYGWSVFTNGEVAGLVAGDMGYDGCDTQWGNLISYATGAASHDICDELHEVLAQLADICAKAINEGKIAKARQGLMQAETGIIQTPLRSIDDEAETSWKFIDHGYDSEADIHFYHTRTDFSPQYKAFYQWQSKIGLRYAHSDMPHDYFVYLQEADRLEMHRLFADHIAEQDAAKFYKENYHDLTVPVDRTSVEFILSEILKEAIQEEIEAEAIICSKRAGMFCETPTACAGGCRYNDDPIHPNRISLTEMRDRLLEGLQKPT